MTRQKKGFWLFIFSLIPGAGELYMGFQKKGLSLMLIWWGCIAGCAYLGFDAILFLLPIIWFYSFFQVHNLKSLSEEEFHSVEDKFLFPTEGFIENKKTFVMQYRNIIAIVLIVLGISGIWDIFTVWLRNFLPGEIYEYIEMFGYQLPTIAISIIMIVIGVKLVKGKKEELAKEDDINDKNA